MLDTPKERIGTVFIYEPVELTKRVSPLKTHQKQTAGSMKELAYCRMCGNMNKEFLFRSKSYSQGFNLLKEVRDALHVREDKPRNCSSSKHSPLVIFATR